MTTESERRGAMPEVDLSESNECAKFRAALNKIVAVKKIDILEILPKLFRERRPAKRTARVKLAKPKAMN